MITHDLIQGSASWHAYRNAHDNASDAPAMMACSTKRSRDQLIAELATGLPREFSQYVQERILDKGHEFEALARPLAEKIIGQDLYPCTGSLEGSRLSASFDGLTILEEVAFEHKRLNHQLRAALSVPECTGADLPLEYQVQMEQQCAVSACERILFMASAWDDDGQLVEELHCWYYPNLELRAQIVAGWEQFHKDVAAWVPPEAKPAPVVGKTPDNLPALLIQVTGAVTASNLPEYKAHALEVFRGINRTLTTDQDFATAESTVKWCADVESRLAAAKDHALSQTATIDELFRTLDDISAEARRTRLELDKLVKARKEEIRGEIVAGGVTALREHIASLNARLGKPYMPQVPADFAGAIKGKRTVDSLRGAVNDELARAKIESSAIADRIQINLGTLRELASAHAFLFADTSTIVLKQPEDLTMLVKSRIADRQAAEQARLDAERERIRAEEAAKLQREAREAEARAERERQEAMRQELLRAEREAQAGIAEARAAEALPVPLLDALSDLAKDVKDDAVAGIDAVEAISAAQRTTASPVVVPMRAAPAPAPAERTGTPTLKLGTINERLGGVVTTNADGLRSLGFAATAVGNSKLYHEADFPEILAALVRHIEAVQSKAAA